MFQPLQRAAIMLAVGLTATACVADAPTVPASHDPAGVVAPLAAPNAADAQRLQDQERRERARVAVERERSATTYDSLDSARASGTLLHALVPGLIVCDPLPYASDVRTIGAAGGELRIGPHRLTIPPGALGSPVVITGEAPVSTAVLVTLSPDGLRFAARATLTLNYSHCARSPSLVETIVQVGDALNVLEVLPSQDTPAGEVSARLGHFSNYAVAW